MLLSFCSHAPLGLGSRVSLLEVVCAFALYLDSAAVTGGVCVTLSLCSLQHTLSRSLAGPIADSMQLGSVMWLCLTLHYKRPRRDLGDCSHTAQVSLMRLGEGPERAASAPKPQPQVLSWRITSSSMRIHTLSSLGSALRFHLPEVQKLVYFDCRSHMLTGCSCRVPRIAICVPRVMAERASELPP